VLPPCSTRVAVTLTGGHTVSSRRSGAWRMVVALSGLVDTVCGSKYCPLRRMSLVTAFISLCSHYVLMPQCEVIPSYCTVAAGRADCSVSAVSSQSPCVRATRAERRQYCGRETSRRQLPVRRPPPPPPLACRVYSVARVEGA
jgi:hypothetical protein